MSERHRADHAAAKEASMHDAQLSTSAGTVERDELWAGAIHLDGGFPESSFREIERLAREVEARTACAGSRSRITRWEWGNGRGVTIRTTERLAFRLVDAIRTAYGGEVRFSFSQSTRQTSIQWRKD
jgi:hypothetical protein